MSITNDGVFYVDGNCALDVFNQDIRETRRANSGFRGLMKAQYGHRLKVQDLMSGAGTPNDMVVHRADGVDIIIPSTWFTKTGKVRKGRLQEYKKLLGV